MVRGDPTFLKNWNPVFQGIGRIAYHWNSFERTGTTLLNALLGGEHRATIATAHMGTNTQLDALKTLAAEFLAEHERDTIFHFITLYERLRERRNFYVHSFRDVTIELLPTEASLAIDRSTFHVRMSGFHAKGRLKQTVTTVTEADLRNEAELIQAANHYASRVVCYYLYPNKPEYRTLPEKILLPARLTKTAKFVLDGQTPPQAPKR